MGWKKVKEKKTWKKKSIKKKKKEKIRIIKIKSWNPQQDCVLMRVQIIHAFFFNPHWKTNTKNNNNWNYYYKKIDNK